MPDFAGDRDRNRKALLIGNDDYSKHRFFQSLGGCRNDVTDLEKELKKMGFSVSKVLDGTKRAMETKITEFNENIEAGDIIVFSFSGHGLEYAGENILYPIDSGTISDLNQLHTVSINAQNVFENILKKQPYFVLFILDCCREYLESFINQQDQFSKSRGLAPMEGPKQNDQVRGGAPRQSWQTLLACRTGELATETKSDRRNGLLTFHLLQRISLRKHIGNIITQVCADVIKTKQGQTPHHYSSFTNGCVCLNKNHCYSDDDNPGSYTNNNQSNESSYKNPDLESYIEQLPIGACAHLYNRSLGDADMDIVVTKAIIGKHCSEIQLDNNCITSKGISKLIRGLESTQALQALYLANNKFDYDGVRTLANALSNEESSVKRLYLGGNNITDAGVKYLADRLKTNGNLTSLLLNTNNITNQGVQVLCKTLIDSSCKLKVLNLSYNSSITYGSVKYLREIILELPALEELRIEECNLSEGGKNELKEAVNSRNAKDGQSKITLVA